MSAEVNPGPFGMGQILGLACPRSEVSGERLWGAIARRHERPETFFRRAVVLNYCPLLFLDERGANVTPDKLAAPERRRLEAVCDDALAEILRILTPEVVVGVGRYAARRAQIVVGRPVVQIPHPSPRSPAANRGWEAAARAALAGAGLGDLL